MLEYATARSLMFVSVHKGLRIKGEREVWRLGQGATSRSPTCIIKDRGMLSGVSDELESLGWVTGSLEFIVHTCLTTAVPACIDLAANLLHWTSTLNIQNPSVTRGRSTHNTDVH